MYRFHLNCLIKLSWPNSITFALHVFVSYELGLHIYWMEILPSVKCDPCWQNESEVARTNFELQAKEMKNVSFG